MPEITQKHARICLKCCSICWKADLDMPIIYLRYAWDISEFWDNQKKGLNMPDIYLRYSQDMDEICLRYTLFMPDIWQTYTQDMSDKDMPEIYLLCALDIGFDLDMPVR